MSRTYDTIIIGAGWAGVVAARELSKSGHSVLILEARDRLGGRARTHTDGMHVPVDLGCSFIHGYKEGNPAREIAQEFGVAAHITRPTVGQVWRTSNGPEQSKTVDQMRANLAAAGANARKMTEDIDGQIIESDVALSEALFSPQSSLYADIEDREVLQAFARTLEVPIGAPLEKTSLRWYGWEDSYAGSDAAPEGGFEKLIEKIVDQARQDGADVLKGEAVRRIGQTNDGIGVTTEKGATHIGATVICTIPLGVLKLSAATLFQPALSQRRLRAIKGTHVGILEKLVLAYPHAWWPDSSTVGSYTLLPSEVCSDEPSTPKSVFRRNTFILASFAAPTLPRQHPTLLFYISTTPALALDHFTAEEIARGAHEFLQERFSVTSAPDPIASTLTNWHMDPLAMGATTTPSIVGEGRGPLDFLELAKPAWGGTLGFAGEHTDPNNRGSVAGAVISGFREADRVKRLLRKKSEF